MSVALPSFTNPVMLSGGSPSPVVQDACQSADVCAVWKSIFERVQAVEAGDGAEKGVPRVPESLAERTSNNAATETGSGRGSVRVTGSLGASDSVHASGSVHRSGLARASNSPTPWQAALAQATIAGNSSVISRHAAHGTAEAAAGPQLASGAGLPERTARQSLAAPLEPPVEESVTLHVDDGNVTMVVRDLRLSDTQAVSCAFETAQRLTGQRATLKQLTLNGRPIYQRPAAFQPEAGAAFMPPFAC